MASFDVRTYDFIGIRNTYLYCVLQTMRQHMSVIILHTSNRMPTAYAVIQSLNAIPQTR